MDDTDVELSDEIDLTKVESIPEEELLEAEVIDPIELLADEVSEDAADEEDDEMAILMDPYGINNY
jgi:hypothetical protein